MIHITCTPNTVSIRKDTNNLANIYHILLNKHTEKQK